MQINQHPQIIVPDEIDFKRYMQESEPRAKIRPASDFRRDAIRFALPNEEEERRTKLPFNGCWFYMRPSEVTAWAGFNGSGKSLLQGQVMWKLAAHGHRIVIASFEMPPGRSLLRMVRQHCGDAKPMASQVDEFLASYGSNIWFYNQQGAITPDRMYAVVRYSAEELKATHVVIDNMLTCVKGEEDRDGQKDFIASAKALAMEYSIHIHIVHHLRKGESDDKMPTRLDMRGSGAISDLVDNVLLVWRNKAKERASGGSQGPSPKATDPDAVLICDKQRNGDWEGRVPLWFDSNGQSYSDQKIKSGML